MIKLYLLSWRLVVILFLIFSNTAYADEVSGVWKTIDDKTHEVRSLVELTIENDKLFGKIIKIFPQPGQPENAVCELCTGSLKNTPVLGLQIVNGLSFKDGVWRDNTILDPDNGKTYNCRVWLEGDSLKVRGYIGFFYRTQEWLRHASTQDTTDGSK